MRALPVAADKKEGGAQISTVEHLRSSGANLAGAILVTTPQAVSVTDVRKEISFCKKMQVPALGIVENMSGMSVWVRAHKLLRASESSLLMPALMIPCSTGFVCPCCEEVTNIFSSGGGEALGKPIPRDRLSVALIAGAGGASGFRHVRLAASDTSVWL